MFTPLNTILCEKGMIIALNKQTYQDQFNRRILTSMLKGSYRDQDEKKHLSSGEDDVI